MTYNINHKVYYKGVFMDRVLRNIEGMIKFKNGFTYYPYLGDVAKVVLNEATKIEKEVRVEQGKLSILHDECLSGIELAKRSGEIVANIMIKARRKEKLNQALNLIEYGRSN